MISDLASRWHYNFISTVQLSEKVLKKLYTLKMIKDSKELLFI